MINSNNKTYGAPGVKESLRVAAAAGLHRVPLNKSVRSVSHHKLSSIVPIPEKLRLLPHSVFSSSTRTLCIEIRKRSERLLRKQPRVVPVICVYLY